MRHFGLSSPKSIVRSPSPKSLRARRRVRPSESAPPLRASEAGQDVPPSEAPARRSQPGDRPVFSDATAGFASHQRTIRRAVSPFAASVLHPLCSTRTDCRIDRAATYVPASSDAAVVWPLCFPTTFARTGENASSWNCRYYAARLVARPMNPNAPGMGKPYSGAQTRMGFPYRANSINRARQKPD